MKWVCVASNPEHTQRTAAHSSTIALSGYFGAATTARGLVFSQTNKSKLLWAHVIFEEEDVMKHGWWVTSVQLQMNETAELSCFPEKRFYRDFAML